MSAFASAVGMPSLPLSTTLMTKRSRNSALLQTSVRQQQEGFFTVLVVQKNSSCCWCIKTFFAAKGMKLRATKAETNGTVKSAEANPVSISASLHDFLFLFSAGRRNPAEARLCAVDGSFSLFTSSFFFPYVSRMKIWSGWRTTFPALWPMCKLRFMLIFTPTLSFQTWQA